MAAERYGRPAWPAARAARPPRLDARGYALLRRPLLPRTGAPPRPPQPPQPPLHRAHVRVSTTSASTLEVLGRPRTRPPRGAGGARATASCAAHRAAARASCFLRPRSARRQPPLLEQQQPACPPSLRGDGAACPPSLRGPSGGSRCTALRKRCSRPQPTRAPPPRALQPFAAGAPTARSSRGRQRAAPSSTCTAPSYATQNRIFSTNLAACSASFMLPVTLQGAGFCGRAPAGGSRAARTCSSATLAGCCNREAPKGYCCAY
jgi:hypothetical protein